MPVTILYRDDSIVVAVKPAGVLSESEGMPAMLEEQIGSPALTVHRLDRETHGVMVYALSASAAAELSRLFRSGEARKRYLAVVEGATPEGGELRDLLFYDRRVGKSYVVARERKGVREALLSYERLSSGVYDGSRVSLVSVELRTGRTHQIRAQFASRRHPIVGDRRYGSSLKREGIALCAHELSFPHPVTGERLSFCCDPQGDIFDL